MKEQKTWFISDTHYGHKNICRGVSEWTDRLNKTRNFQTLEEMNKAILKGINNNVGQDDVLYHLGDWSFGGIENIWDFRRRIICKNVHLILGNHDQHIKKNKPLESCKWHPSKEFIFNAMLYKQDFPIFNNIKEKEEFIVHAKDLFTSVQGYLELEINKQLFVLSHYPMEEWFEMDRKGSIMLHGHNHHTKDNHPINKTYRRMDVGIDWEEFRPYSLEEILKLNLIKEKRTHNGR